MRGIKINSKEAVKSANILLAKGKNCSDVYAALSRETGLTVEQSSRVLRKDYFFCRTTKQFEPIEKLTAEQEKEILTELRRCENKGLNITNTKNRICEKYKINSNIFAYLFSLLENEKIKEREKNKCLLCKNIIRDDDMFCSPNCAIEYMRETSDTHEKSIKLYDFLCKKIKGKVGKCEVPTSQEQYELIDELKLYRLIDYRIVVEGFKKPVSKMIIEVWR